MLTRAGMVSAGVYGLRDDVRPGCLRSHVLLRWRHLEGESTGSGLGLAVARPGRRERSREMDGASSGGQLPVRWVLILLLAVLVGVLFGALTLAQVHAWPAALLAGLGAAGATTVGAHQVVARR